MHRVHIRVELDDMVAGVINDNRTTLIDLLRKNGFEVQPATERQKEELPSVPTEEVGTKSGVEIAMVLVASAAPIAALGHAIPRILREIANLQFESHSYHEWVSQRDADGSVVRKKNGELVGHWVSRKELIRPSPTAAESDASEVEVEGYGIKVGAKGERRVAP
jgi:hypothetical protein